MVFRLTEELQNHSKWEIVLYSWIHLLNLTSDHQVCTVIAGSPATCRSLWQDCGKNKKSRDTVVPSPLGWGTFPTHTYSLFSGSLHPLFPTFSYYNLLSTKRKKEPSAHSQDWQVLGWKRPIAAYNPLGRLKISQGIVMRLLKWDFSQYSECNVGWKFYSTSRNPTTEGSAKTSSVQ